MTRVSNVGELLRSRREQLGIPLDVAADATNIRARMLATLESGDFSKYPPHGHAKGMLSSYARYLELDSRDVLERFETAYTAFLANEEMAQSAARTRRGVGRYGEHVSATDKPITRDSSRARKASRSSDDIDTPATRLTAKLSDEQVAEGDNRYVSGSVKVVSKRSPEASRHIEPPRAGQVGSRSKAHGSRLSGSAYSSSATGHGASDTSDAHEDSSAVTTRETSARSSGATPDGVPSHHRLSTRPHTRSALRGEDIARDEHLDSDQREALSYFGDAASAGDESQNARPRIRHRSQEARGESQGADGGFFSRVVHTLAETFADPRGRLVALAVIALAIALVIALAVFLSATGQHDADVIDVEGGVEQTESVEQEEGSATATVTTTNGNPITVIISVGEGETSLVTVTYDDDKDYSGTAVGPWEREFLVTESLSATFGNPDAVTITENGNEVQVATLEDGTGEFYLEVQTVSAEEAQDSSADEDAAE